VGCRRDKNKKKKIRMKLHVTREEILQNSKLSIT
jgi:hypothetical protein